jgi:hypothetical protein
MGGVSFHPGSNRALVESQTFNRKATPPFSFTHFLIVPLRRLTAYPKQQPGHISGALCVESAFQQTASAK